ncbi:MAG: type II toxin-antitoxin system mRNA interferase toxin, RelE/StbE family [Parcubacteria group bacterium]|nr:type II toxin-antitoxin system mRNA interferase toxin, RelE/StbE family [Parcubacteria group bacterium]
MIIRTTPYFDRRFKKLPPAIKRKAVEREKIFLENHFDLRLKTHKLHGKKKDEWAYSIDYRYRISFIFVIGGEVLYTDIGTHDDVY